MDDNLIGPTGLLPSGAGQWVVVRMAVAAVAPGEEGGGR